MAASSTNFRVVGRRFRPTDKELIGYYLFRKIKGRLTPKERRQIRDCDLYSEEPNQVWERFEGEWNHDNDMFFFTKLKRINKEDGSVGSRIERKVGGGKWHGEDAGTSLKVVIRDIVNGRLKRTTLNGKKKRFNYKNEESNQHCLWIMHEYSLELDQDWVVCRLRNNVRYDDEHQTITSSCKKRKGSIIDASNKKAKLLSANELVQESQMSAKCQPCDNVDGEMVQESVTDESQIVPKPPICVDDNNNVLDAVPLQTFPNRGVDNDVLKRKIQVHVSVDNTHQLPEEDKSNLELTLGIKWV